MIKRNPRIVKRNVELWKPIMGFPTYAVSNMGRVKSIERFVEYSDARIYLYKEKMLKLSKDKGGYLIVSLWVKNKGRTTKVHQLVLAHFGPLKPSPKHECNHGDGDKENNWDTNLSWMTHVQNMDHALDNELHHTGEDHPGSKLTEKEVRKIRKLNTQGNFTQSQLGKMFGVSQGGIWSILHFKIWKHIKEDLL